MRNKFFIKYLLVGVFNTFFGYGIIFACMYFGVVAEVSNFIGYFFGIIVSYKLNKKFTFNSVADYKDDFFKFVGSMYIAYIINLITLVVCIRYLNINHYIGQLVAAISYTLSGYLLSRNWVFNDSKKN